MNAKTLLAATGMAWLPSRTAPASPAPLSPGCVTSLCWQSQPNSCWGSSGLTVQGGEHLHLLMQKTFTVLLSGTVPSGRAWTKAAAPSHSLFTCASRACCSEWHCSAPGGVSMGRKRKGSQHNLLFLPVLLSSHRKPKGKC